MKVTSSHTKNPAVGWDISASAIADLGEKIARAQIRVNGGLKYDKSFNPPISSWQQQLSQQGEYPGDNSVEVVVTSDKGDDTEADDAWN